MIFTGYPIKKREVWLTKENAYETYNYVNYISKYFFSWFCQIFSSVDNLPFTIATWSAFPPLLPYYKTTPVPIPQNWKSTIRSFYLNLDPQILNIAIFSDLHSTTEELWSLAKFAFNIKY